MSDIPPILPAAKIERMAKLVGKHAEERARLEAEQHNARVKLFERQKLELEAASREGAGK